MLIMIVQCALLKCYTHYTILGYSTETVLLIFPFLQTNITVQMRPSGGWRHYDVLNVHRYFAPMRLMTVRCQPGRLQFDRLHSCTIVQAAVTAGWHRHVVTWLENKREFTGEYGQWVHLDLYIFGGLFK